MNLFKIIDKGDPSIGLPPYNGGLFASEAAALLERVRLADSEVAPIIYGLSHSPRVRRGIRHQRPAPAGASSTTATCPSSSSARSTSGSWRGSRRAATPARSPSGPIPTPARTAAASTRPRSSSI